MPSPHLHPMSPDSLRPRPAPQAAASGAPVRLTAPVQRPVPAPLSGAAKLPAEEKLPEECILDLLSDDLLLFPEEDDDEDENEPDAVPTESMPIPVCVPLYEVSLADIPRSKRKK